MALQNKPGGFVTYDATATTQLTYGVQTNPSPLTVSQSATDFTAGSIEVVVTNNTRNPLPVSSITFNFSVGTTGTYGPPLMQNTTGVQASINDTVNWALTPPVQGLTSGSASAILKPKTGLSVTLAPGANVTLEIFNFPTVLTPTNSTLAVTEIIGVTTGNNSITITTFPVGFFFNSLVAAIPQGVNWQPVASLPINNSGVTLFWNSSVVDTSSVAIYYSGGGSTPVTPTNVDQWSSPALTIDNVFTVVITAATVGGQSITASLSVPVTVANPQLVPTSVNTGTLTVSGTTNLNGATTISAGLTTTSTVTANGAVNANAQLTANNFALTNISTQVGTTASITGPTPPTSGTAASQAYTAPTDGFVIGFVGANNTGQSSQLSIGWITITNSAGAYAAGTGGNYLTYLQPNILQVSSASLNQSVILPVRANERFTITTQVSPNNQSAPQMSFWFIPIGKGTPSTTTSLVGGDVTQQFATLQSEFPYLQKS